jgi:RNA polymerase sigma-70 factor (ECF subfamily)
MDADARAEDARLVAAAAEGDAAAFEALVRRHIDSVYGHGLRFFGEPQAAEDVTQEVFVKLYRSLDSYEGTAAFTTWLFTVTRNTCLDMLRQGKRRPVPVDPVDLAVSTSPDHAQGVVDTAALEQAVQALPPEDREALGAVTLFGLTYGEAAEELGVPVGTVKSRVFRARRALVTILGLSGGGSR